MSNEMLRRLDDIVKNTQPKAADIMVTLHGKSTSLSSNFNPPIKLDPRKNYVVRMDKLLTHFSIPNINSTNNAFRYSPDNKATWFDITLPVGFYEIADILPIIEKEMQANGHYDSKNEKYYIDIKANLNTLKIDIVIAANYQLDFSQNGSVASVFGYKTQILTEGTYSGENIVNITTLNTIDIYCNIVEGSYVNGQKKQILYSFYPKERIGHKINENPQNPIKLAVIKTETIGEIKVDLRDQDGNLLSNTKEDLSVMLVISEQ